MKCTALILAGSRGAPDDLCTANGVAHKALIEIGGQAMLARVVEALLACDLIGGILISVAQPEPVLALAAVAAHVETGRVRLVTAAATPGESVLAVLNRADHAWPLLVTTADHPLLRAGMITHFLAHAPDADAVAAVVEQAIIMAAYPQTVRTYLRFSDAAVSGANLFLLRNAKARGVVAFWRHVEDNRKQPMRLMRMLGLGVILRFVTGRLDLRHALQKLGRRCGAELGVVRLPFAQAAIDVDKQADLELAERILAAETR
ncbi:MAG: NTP transferase domain-containing protein [Pseudomonadota bacterium]